MKIRTVLSVLFAVNTLVQPPFMTAPVLAQSSPTVQEKESCVKNLKLVYEAIQAYRRDHKELPNWLSDLTPSYIADPAVLVCPVAKRTGAQRLFGISDPKVTTSYVYEFCAQKVPGEIWGGHELTMGEYKRLQMALVGGQTPILRCHLHQPVLNVGFDGTVYESATTWEEKFKDVVPMADLAPRAVAARVLDTAKVAFSEEDRFRRQILAVQRAARATNTTELDNAIAALQKDFSTRPEVSDTLLSLALESDPEQARKLAKAVVQSKAAPDQAKEFAQSLIKKTEAVGKPLDLTFTALDGRQVTVGSMKGKVILVDFWATWCGPCVAELPNVKAAYDKLHGRGFEIVGISFDTSKDALSKFVASKGMSWPQYFDGKGWQNKFGREFGITSIPAMWLVDKKGILRDVNAREGLAQKVEKLMAATD